MITFDTRLGPYKPPVGTGNGETEHTITQGLGTRRERRSRHESTSDVIKLDSDSPAARFVPTIRWPRINHMLAVCDGARGERESPPYFLLVPRMETVGFANIYRHHLRSCRERQRSSLRLTQRRPSCVKGR